VSPKRRACSSTPTRATPTSRCTFTWSAAAETRSSGATPRVGIGDSAGFTRKELAEWLRIAHGRADSERAWQKYPKAARCDEDALVGRPFRRSRHRRADSVVPPPFWPQPLSNARNSASVPRAKAAIGKRWMKTSALRACSPAAAIKPDRLSPRPSDPSASALASRRTACYIPQR
jgi:hypothetical protein